MGTADWGDKPFFRGGDPSTTVDVDRALDVLSDPVRRTLLEFLASSPEDVLEADAVIAYLSEESPRSSDMDSEVVEMECYHRHLPKLDDAGVIEHDPRMGDIRYNRDETIEHLLDTIANLES